jgi:PAS domain S-box-containing protein
MVNKVYRSFSNLIVDDLKSSRVIFFLVGTSFLAFAMFGANAPLLGYIPHRLLNLIPAVTSFLFLGIMLSYRMDHNARQRLIIILIYEINLINIYLLYATQHMDMYAYQFLVSYVLSSYFFGSQSALLNFILVVNAGVVITGFTSHAKSSSPSDFYMTFVVCEVVYGIIYRFRFSVEERLLESERKYRLLAENSFDIICMHSIDAKLQFVSPSIKRMLGYQQGDMLGKYPMDFAHPDDVYIMRALDFNDPNRPFMDKPVQFRLRHASGEYIWFETIFTMLDKEDADSGFILSQSREISQRKRYQLELEERSKDLERSNIDLETFAFVSSHDMQEPLRMIANYTQLLKKKYADKIDKEAEEYIDFAHKGALNLQQLIRDLLSYSRITRTDMKRIPVNMNLLMAELMANIKLELQEKNAEVHYEDLHPVSGDKNLIMLVMQNLILNGVKYNQSSRPEIKIKSSSTGKEIIYCVADNGIGIDARHQQRIFEPFHRLHTKHEYPGTGLGLSICKKIIEKSSGKIWLESEPERGTKFFFSLS